jgi:hypothetical protein
LQRATELTTFHPPDLPRTRLDRKVREVRSFQVTERGFFAPRTTQQKVDALFAEFTGMGFGYSLGIGGADSVLGTQLSTPLRHNERMRDAFGGNCIAFSQAFAQVVRDAGVKAEARVVRREEAGRAFIVYAPHFIDREVPGNIYKEGILWQSHYLFSNHMATWVPELNIYYDPMAGITYRDIAPHVVMELATTDGSDNAFSGTYSARTWNLVRREEILAGQFSRFDMTPV